jgi:hypothetical protein
MSTELNNTPVTARLKYDGVEFDVEIDLEQSWEDTTAAISRCISAQSSVDCLDIMDSDDDCLGIRIKSMEAFKKYYGKGLYQDGGFFLVKLQADQSSNNFKKFALLVLDVVPKVLQQLFIASWDAKFGSVYKWSETDHQVNGQRFVKGVPVFRTVEAKPLSKLEKNKSVAYTGAHDLTADLKVGDTLLVNGVSCVVEEVVPPQLEENPKRPDCFITVPGRVSFKDVYRGESYRPGGPDIFFSVVCSYEIEPMKRANDKGVDKFVLENYEKGDVLHWDITALAEALINDTRNILDPDSNIGKLVARVRSCRNECYAHIVRSHLASDKFIHGCEIIKALLKYCEDHNIIAPDSELLAEYQGILEGDHSYDAITFETLAELFFRKPPEEQLRYLWEELHPENSLKYVKDRESLFLPGTRQSHVNRYLEWVKSPMPQHGAKLFCISGTHGAGKSTLLSHLYHLTDTVLAEVPHCKGLHFYRYGSCNTLRLALRSLSYSVAQSNVSLARSKSYRQSLLVEAAVRRREAKEAWCSESISANELVASLFTKQLKEGHEDTPVLLFVDAIDECFGPDKDEQIRQLTAQLPNEVLAKIDNNLWIIISAVEPLGKQLGLGEENCIHLETGESVTDGDECFGDIQKYAKHVLQKYFPGLTYFCLSLPI